MSPSTPAPHAPQEPRRTGRVWRTLRAVLLVAGVLGALGFAWLWFAPCGFGGCAPVTDLERFQAEGSELLDVDGEPFATLATVDRRVVPLDSLPEHLTRAFLAVEDRRFYEHSGVDWMRMAGAVTTLFGPGRAEGGSTITMQLARNLFPERLPYTERSVRRKVMEIRVARQIERAFPKEKILELYLNHIYLGEGAYGVEAAAREYFGKPAAELDLAEAALLGGLPKAPSQINPRADREAARERRDLVLRAMAEAGYVSAEEAEAAREEPVRLAKAVEGEEDDRWAYFRSQVRRELEAQVGDRFYTAGLRVYTTLDPRVQAAAEEELARQLDAIEAGRFGSYGHPTYPEAKGESENGTTPYLQGAVVVLDAATGEVRALVGGRDWRDSNFDRATQALRQPGSAFKPFVYLTALEHGLPPTHRVEDAPLRLTLDGRTWEPKNYTGRYDGPLSMREGLVRSKNTVAVRVAQEVGMGPVVRTARELGVRSPVSPLPSTALGASEVRPLELAQAYAAFANGGDRVEPRLIRRIESRYGEVLWEAPERRERVVDPAVAFVLTSMLRDVVDRGTGAPVRAAGFREAAAGKTGTTNRATDVWFAGYTPELVGVVWMGLDRPATIVRGASGGTLAAPVWGRIMRRVYDGRPAPRPWSPPPGVVSAEVDRATGAVVDPSCPARGSVYTEHFVGSPPPRQVCYPGMEYPRLAGGDTLWVDEEWGAGMEGDTLSEVAPGIYWPELAEMRREEEGPPPPPEVELEAPEPVQPREAPPVVGEPVAPPAEEPRPRPEPARPEPAEPEPAPAREPPELLGEPVERPPPPAEASGTR